MSLLRSSQGGGSYIVSSNLYYILYNSEVTFV